MLRMHQDGFLDGTLPSCRPLTVFDGAPMLAHIQDSQRRSYDRQAGSLLRIEHAGMRRCLLKSFGHRPLHHDREDVSIILSPVVELNSAQQESKMSDRITWTTCPHCGEAAAIGWLQDKAVEFDCKAGCAVTDLHLLGQGD